MNAGERYPTYSLLGPRATRPSEYEIVSSHLLYYVERGFEVKVPIGEWYDRYQRSSPFRCGDWERFADPRATTYSSYTRLSHVRERTLDEVFEAAEESGETARLAGAWCEVLNAAMGPLRYPLQGLHMLACYVGQMAPSGRITMAALFQAADELGRIDRLAYRTRILQRAFPGFAEDAKARWERADEWQPLRETIERMLITYDWGEAFVALNLCLKPWLDALIGDHLAGSAARTGDGVLVALLQSFDESRRWHEAWSHALVNCVCADTPATRDVLGHWLEYWTPRVLTALHALSPLFGATGPLPCPTASHRALLRSFAPALTEKVP